MMINYPELPKQGLHDSGAPPGVNEKSSRKMAGALGKKQRPRDRKGMAVSGAKGSARQAATKELEPRISDGTDKRPFNAKTQSRKDAKREETLCDFAPLRLCVKIPLASVRTKSSRE